MLETDPDREVQAPHWKCEYCGTRVYNPELDLHRQVCGCGKGKGRWGVINGELIGKVEVPSE